MGSVLMAVCWWWMLAALACVGGLLAFCGCVEFRRWLDDRDRRRMVERSEERQCEVFRREAQWWAAWSDQLGEISGLPEVEPRRRLG